MPPTYECTNYLTFWYLFPGVLAVDIATTFSGKLKELVETLPGEGTHLMVLQDKGTMHAVFNAIQVLHCHA